MFSNNVTSENSSIFYGSNLSPILMRRSNSSPILTTIQLMPFDIGINIQPQTSASVLKNDMNALNKNIYEQKIENLKHWLPELEAQYARMNGIH